MSWVDRIDSETPADRDRYLDLLRVASILLVVLGHWVVRVVTDADGELAIGYLLALAPGSQWATLLVQVMPLFFLVGGVVNAQSWRRARDRRDAAAAWVELRAQRLLRPTLPLVAVLVILAVLLHQLAPEYEVIFGFRAAIFPIWFLAAYILVTALTPLTLAWHERWGSGLLLACCALAVLLVDSLRFTVFADGPFIGTQPAVAAINVVIVWLAIHQVGYLWADDQLPRTRSGQMTLLLAGIAALLLMIGVGPYPLTMVPIEGSQAPNNAGPPTGALFGLVAVQLAVVLMLRSRLTAWLENRVAWALVALLGAGLMTVYLWHQPAMVLAANIVYPLGWMPLRDTVDLQWWLLRLPWVAICAMFLAIVVALAWRFETAPAARGAPGSWRHSPLVSLSGVLLFGFGVAGFIELGLTQPGMPLSLPWVPLAAYLIALWLLGVIRYARRT